MTNIPGVYVGNPSEQDLRDLKLYSVAVMLGALVVGHMVYVTWMNGAWEFLAEFATATFLPDGTVGSKMIILFATGIYFGLLGVFANDHRKRYQGIPVFLGSLVFIAFLGVLGLGVVNFGPSPLNLLSLVTGLIVGVSVELVPIDGTPLDGELQYFDPENSLIGRAANRRGETLEFDAAAIGLKYYIFGLIIAGNAMNVYLSMPTPGLLQAIHLVASGAFLYFLHGFVDIDVTPSIDETEFEVIGPKLSGKSYLALGLYLAADRNDAYTVRGWNNGFGELRTEYRDVTHYADRDADLTWNIEGNVEGQVRLYRFDLEVGEITPSRYGFSIVDYAGELLDDIGTTMSKGRPIQDGGERIDDEDDDENRQDGFPTREYDKDDIVDEEPNLGREPGKVEDGDLFEGTDDEEWPEPATRNGDSAPAGSESEPPSSGSEGELGEQDYDWDGVRSSENDDNETGPGQDHDRLGGSSTSTEQDRESETANGAESDDSVPQSPERRASEIDSTDAAIEFVVESIRSADCLLMLIDGARFYGGAPAGAGSKKLETESMRQIAETADVDEVVPIVTKADHFIEDFKRQHGYVEDDPTSDNHWNEFRTFVTDRINESTVTSSFFDVLDADTVYPVYFHTEEREMAVDDDGEQRGSDVGKSRENASATERRTMPEPGENGELQPEGYGNVLEYLTRDT